MIDTIISEECESETEKMDKIKKQICIWTKNNEVPSNILATFIKQARIEEEKQKKKEFEEEQTLQKDEESSA